MVENFDTSVKFSNSAYCIYRGHQRAPLSSGEGQAVYCLLGQREREKQEASPHKYSHHNLAHGPRSQSCLVFFIRKIRSDTKGMKTQELQKRNYSFFYKHLGRFYNENLQRQDLILIGSLTFLFGLKTWVQESRFTIIRIVLHILTGSDLIPKRPAPTKQFNPIMQLVV